MKYTKIVALTISLLLLAASLLFGSVLLLRLFIATALVLAVSYMWTKANLRGLTLAVGRPPEHLQAGDVFHRQVSISNQGKWPRLWVKLEDNTDLPGSQDTAMVTIGGRSLFQWQTTFTCRRRGLYHLGPVTLSTSDPLGIFTEQRTLGEKQDIIVYPTTVDLPLFRFASFSDFGYGSGYQSISRISPNASSVREYASGDSLHHIHWKSTARTGNLMVKMFDADRSYNASKTGWVLLDMNEDAHFGREELGSEEKAVTVAASIVKKYLQGGMRLGLIASDDKKSFFPPERTEEQLWNVLGGLAVIRADWKMKLSSVVAERMDNLRDNPLVIIISTSASEDLSETVRLLRNRVDSVVVVLIDIASYGGHPAASEVARPLMWTGAQVYTVGKNDELAKALDSKTTRVQPATV